MKEVVTKNNPQPDYEHLLITISETYSSGQVKATQAVNTQLLETYWQIGRHIVEFEQGGNVRAEYGKALMSNLAKDLSLLHGKGFSRSNILYMRLLYIRYPISQKPSHQLSWSHFVELLKIEDDSNKEEILKLASQGLEIARPSDILKDPYVFEFLKIPEEQLPSELELETLLYEIEHEPKRHTEV